RSQSSRAERTRRKFPQVRPIVLAREDRNVNATRTKADASGSLTSFVRKSDASENRTDAGRSNALFVRSMSESGVGPRLATAAGHETTRLDVVGDRFIDRNGARAPGTAPRGPDADRDGGLEHRLG